MRSKSSKRRVFPDQSCSAGVAMRSAALVRDRFVAARGGCVDTPAPLVGRGLPRAKGAFAKGEPSSNSPVKFGKKCFSWCLASTMRRPDLLVFAPSLAALRPIRSARRHSISSWGVSTLKLKGMSETRKGMRTGRLLAEGVQPLACQAGVQLLASVPWHESQTACAKIATLARVANRLRKKLLPWHESQTSNFFSVSRVSGWILLEKKRGDLGQWGEWVGGGGVGEHTRARTPHSHVSPPSLASPPFSNRSRPRPRPRPRRGRGPTSTSYEARDATSRARPRSSARALDAGSSAPA